jgi:bacillithiol system protein YtxJ
MINEIKTFGTINMNWLELNNEDQLDGIIEDSKNTPVLIFKHSTSCSISSMAINRLERAWKDDVNLKPYYLDLIRYRNISNLISNKLGIEHQSPQAIVIKNGEAIYNNSHMGISYNEIEGFVKN